MSKKTVQIVVLALVAAVLGAMSWRFARPRGEPLTGVTTARRPARPNAYWGVSIGMRPEEARKRGLPFPPDMRDVAALGADHIAIPIVREQAALDDDGLDGAPPEVDDAVVHEVIRDASNAGLESVLVLTVHVAAQGPEETRAHIAPRDPARWWASYDDFVMETARLARREQVSLFVIGNGLTSMARPEDAARWKALAARVRKVFDGRLGYIADYDALDASGPFAAVNVIGVNADFPLAVSPDAHLSVLEDAWQAAARRLRALHRRTHAPIVLFRVGYPSVVGAAVRPSLAAPDEPIDLRAQQEAYEACADTLTRDDFISGALFWEWLGPGGPNDPSYMPRGKPAERELRRLFAARGSRR